MRTRCAPRREIASSFWSRAAIIAEAGKPEDPGAIKTYRFDNGMLSNLASIAPGNGLGFGPRHLDFHPSEPWALVSIERQNKLYVYKFDATTGLARDPLFIKDTLPRARFAVAARRRPDSRPSERQVRLSDQSHFSRFRCRIEKSRRGRREHRGWLCLDAKTGEPKRLQNIEGHGIQLRTFGIDPSGRMLAVASIMPLNDGTLPAGIMVYRIAVDGILSFVRKYDVDVGKAQQFWSGMVTL